MWTPPYVDAPMARTFLTLPQIGRLQPYVRPLSATSWPLALMIIADRIPNHAIALLGAGLHGLFQSPALAGLHHVSIALPN